MSYVFQIDDPEGLQLTIRSPGKHHSPDILEDVKRRLVDAYKEALEARLKYAKEQSGLADLWAALHDDDEETEDEEEGDEDA